MIVLILTANFLLRIDSKVCMNVSNQTGMFPVNIKKVETHYWMRTIITHGLYLVSKGKDRLYQIIHMPDNLYIKA